MSKLSSRRPPPSPLTQTLRAIRRQRGLRACDVAQRMNMKLRTYEHFEAQAGRLAPERLAQFAVAADCDPYALLAAAVLNASPLALACADNKLIAIMAILLEEFVAEVGGAIADLTPRQAQRAFSKVFRELTLGLAATPQPCSHPDALATEASPSR